MKPTLRWLRGLVSVLAIAAMVATGLPFPGSVHAADGNPGPCVDDDNFRFVVTITNLSDRTGTPTAFAPGIWALADKPGVLFVPGPHPGLLYWNADPIKTPGLENLAEDGDPSVLADVLAQHGIVHGVFERPVGADGPGWLLPGGKQAFVVDARYAPRKLSVAFMFAESNDWFVATDANGIALENAWGGPTVGGDVSRQLFLWDAGTEADEPSGEGLHQLPRQRATGSGPLDDDNTVRLVRGHDTPDVADLVRVVITREYPTVFDVTVRNIADVSAPEMAFSPGVFVAHTDPATTYMEGHPQLFKEGRPHLFNGLEALAEDGNPDPLYGYISTAGWMSEVPVDGSYGVFDTPVDASGPRLLRPGEEFHFSVDATPHTPFLSLATMLVQSNDWFVATPANGVRLFDADRNPFSGTIPVHVFDAGTEADEPLGVGPHQAPRQNGPNSGPADDDNTVRRVPDMDAAELVSVTVAPRKPRTFRVEVSNVSGSREVAPGIVLAHGACRPLFNETGSDHGIGLANLTNEGGAARLAENLTRQGLTVHVLDTPMEGEGPGPLLPGEAYEAMVHADPAEPNLSLAFMLLPAGAVFVGTPSGGIPLWDSRGNPVTGEITAALSLWDVGAGLGKSPDQEDTQPSTRAGTDAGQADPDNIASGAGIGGGEHTVSSMVSVVVTPVDPE